MFKSKISTWPFYDEDEINAAKNVLISGNVNYWTGNETRNFEKNFSNFCDTNFAIALANGSVALTCAYLSLGIKRGDQFITSPRSFIATASSGAIIGAEPLFADVDVRSGCITAESIEPLINKKTKAISVVHLGGWPAEMESICNLARNYNIPVIEDCAQAHGAKIKVNDKFQSVGGFGDLSAWSFCQDKIISTGGEGGMITTNNKALWEYIWSIKDHGKNYDLVNQKIKNNSFRFIHDKIGTNLRLTEFQSSIGNIQLKKIEETRYKRENNAMILASALKKVKSLRIPLPTNNIKHAWYRFYVYLKKEYLKSEWNRERIIYEINKEGFPAFSGSCGEIYNEKSLKDFKLENLKNAKILGETSIAFLVHPNITSNQIQEYSDRVSKIMSLATK